MIDEHYLVLIWAEDEDYPLWPNSRLDWFITHPPDCPMDFFFTDYPVHACLLSREIHDKGVEAFWISKEDEIPDHPAIIPIKYWNINYFNSDLEVQFDSGIIF